MIAGGSAPGIAVLASRALISDPLDSRCSRAWE
jgi:hypothetical protein